MERQHTGFRFSWIPRTLLIAFILFLTMFSLDVFEVEATFVEQLGGFIIHSVPSLILVVVLLISWKHALVGGVLCIACAVAFMLRWHLAMGDTFLTLILPLIVIGALFILVHFAGRRSSTATGRLA